MHLITRNSFIQYAHMLSLQNYQLHVIIQYEFSFLNRKLHFEGNTAIRKTQAAKLSNKLSAITL